MSEADHDQTIPAPIGERLRIAREAKGMSLDDVAARTRIPTRHLQHIEKGEWDALPATTYSVGFARAYANAIGLNGSAIASELRDQLGGGHGRATSAPTSYYEPADPARVPPRSLAIVAAVIAVLLVAGYLIWRGDAVDEPVDETAAVETELNDPQPAAQPAQPQQQPAPTGPVVLTATEEVWLRIYEAGGARIAERTLQAGERFEVPATAQRPQILTGRPQALRVTVGDTEIPPLGQPERTISDVSLLPADLLARRQQPAPAPAPAR